MLKMLSISNLLFKESKMLFSSSMSCSWLKIKFSYSIISEKSDKIMRRTDRHTIWLQYIPHVHSRLKCLVSLHPHIQLPDLYMCPPEDWPNSSANNKKRKFNNKEIFGLNIKKEKYVDRSLLMFELLSSGKELNGKFGNKMDFSVQRNTIQISDC